MRFPNIEQAVLLAMFPDDTGIVLCASHPVLGFPL
jgi:hypothetical protein